MNSIRHALKCIRQQMNVKHVQRSDRCNEHLSTPSHVSPPSALCEACFVILLLSDSVCNVSLDFTGHIYIIYPRKRAFTLFYHHGAVTYFPHAEGHKRCGKRRQMLIMILSGAAPCLEKIVVICEPWWFLFFVFQTTTAAIRRQHAEDTSCTSASESWAGRYFLLKLHLKVS